ncbi:MAG: MFS transporter [Asgard group archaeon]|nr:MFS transporter [Asgard group archaeon]
MNERIEIAEKIVTNKDKKEWKKFLKIYLVLAILFLVMFTMRATVTILQVFVPDMTIFFEMGEEAKLTIIFTIYNMSAAAISLFVGPLSEKIGYKIMIYTGMIVFASAMMISTLAIDFWMLALGQSLAGIGAALFGPSVIAYASDYFPKEKSSTAIGIIMSSFYVATIIVVPINSYIADLLNWRWGVGIMVILGFLVAILIILIVPRLKQIRSKEEEEEEETIEDITTDSVKPQSYMDRVKIVLKNKYAIGTFFITLFQRGGLFAMTALLSTWILDEFSIEDNYVSGLILMGAGIAALTSNSIFSWLSDKFERKRWVILVGTGLTALWIGIFPLLAFSKPLAIFGFILVNFFGGISMGSYNAFVAEVEPKAKGTTISINNTFGQFSQAIAIAIIARVIYARIINRSYSRFSAYSYSGFAAMGFLTIAVILMIFFVKPKKEAIIVNKNEQHKIKE